MKKILIVVLSAIASLGVAFGASVVASADEVGTALNITSVSELQGKTIVSTGNIGSATELDNGSLNTYIQQENTFLAEANYNSQSPIINNCTRLDVKKWHVIINYSTSGGSGSFDMNSSSNNYNLKLTFNDSEVIFHNNNNNITSSVAEGYLVEFFNNNFLDITPAPPEPEPAGNLWTSILTGIGGFLSGMFALISGAFSGVVNVFYANNTATIILQALIFAAAAALVAAAVYVVVRLIKSAVARLRGGVGAAGAKGDKNKKSKRFFFRKRR